MKKSLLFIALITLLGCKKENSTEVIQVAIVVPANTTYSFSAKNSNNDVSIPNGQANNNFTLIAHSGDKIPVTYEFQTQQAQYGQGTITFTYNSKVLLLINGGYGNQTVVAP